jgi:hypothetical protein
MSRFGKLPFIPVEPVDIIVDGSRSLILHDCEPDDKVAIAHIYGVLPTTIPMLLLTVSPQPHQHTREIIELIDHIKPKDPENARELTILSGAKYGNNIEGKFKEPEDQSYAIKLNNFIMGAPDNSVIVHMLTTCYSLMKHWKDEWATKIRIVFNMGGEGVPRLDKEGKIMKDETGKDIKTLGFNYRVGTEYVHDFMTKIPLEKRIILETNIYNPEFKRKFNGIVSICPRTFVNFSAILMEEYIALNPFVKCLVDSNKLWVDSQLQGWEEGGKYYPDKKMKHFYFGPADILLAVCSFNPKLYTLKLREIQVGDKKYSIHSMTDLDFKLIDVALTEFINDTPAAAKSSPDEFVIDVNFKRPSSGGLMWRVFDQ